MFYLVVFLIALLFASGVDFIKKKQIKGVLFILLVLFLSCVGGFRDVGVGTDTVTYSESYYYAAKEIRSFTDLFSTGRDIGYLLLNLIAVYFDALWVAHFLGQLMTHSLILYVAYLLKRKYSVINFTLFVFVYLFVFYNQTYNFMRQYCAMAVTMVGFYYMLQSNWKFFGLSLVVSFYFHPSAAFFAIAGVYYYMCVSCKSRFYTWLAIIGAVLSIILTTRFYYILSEFNDIGLISDVYTDRYGDASDFKGRDGFRPTVLFVFFAMFYIMYRAYTKSIFKVQYILFWCTLHISYIAFSLLSLFSVFLYRLGLFFYLPNMMFASFVVGTRKISFIEKTVFCSVILLDWIVYIYIHNGGDTIPYKSQILGIYAN